MGCGCNKNNLKEEDLNFHEKEENNLNYEDVFLNNNDINNNQDKEQIFKKNKNQESVVDLNEKDKSDDKLKNQYNQRVFELINTIRLNPANYSKIIIDNIKNISIENHKELNKNNGMEELKQIIVFKKKVKVKLFRGKEGFIEAAKILEDIPPMPILKFNKNIIIPLPNSEEEIKNSNIKKKKINQFMSNSNINAYFKEYIKNPEVAVLLMIVDDNEISNGKKRQSLLNKDFRNIGIDSKFIGKNFIAHLSFSK